MMTTHTHTQPFYGSLDSVRDNPGEPAPEETFTHSHLSWSTVILYLLPSCITIHGILPVQFTCLTVFFHNLSSSFPCLPLGLAPSTSFSIHLFTQSSSSFKAHAQTISTHKDQYLTNLYRCTKIRHSCL